MIRLMGAWLTVLFLAGVATTAAEPPPQRGVLVREGRVSVVRPGVPLMHVLLEISRRAGVRIELESGLHDRAGREKTAVTFDSVTIEDGLRRLFRDQNFAFVYTAEALTEARIYGDGSGEFVDVGSLGRKKPETKKKPLPGHPDGDVSQTPLAGPDGKHAARTVTSERARLLAELTAAGDDEALLNAALETLERDQQDLEALEAALDALLGLDKVPVDELMKFAATTADPDLRGLALQLLGEHGDGMPSVVAFLSNLARTSPDPQIRDDARSVLADLRRPPSPPEPPTPRPPPAPPVH